MPRITDDNTQLPKKFKKKPYRPWNLLDEPSLQDPSIDTESVTNQLVISNQSISNQKDTKKQNIETNYKSISNQISNQNKISNRNQLVTNIGAFESVLDSIRRLYGLQRKILFYIVDHCCRRGQLSSGEITNESFRQLTKTDGNTVKTAIQRLVTKGLVKREIGKRGVGGFSSFLISESVRNATIEEKGRLEISNQIVTELVTNISNQIVTNRGSNKEPTPLSSSSDLIETTTDEVYLEQKRDNLDVWKKLNIDPLINIGFSQTHLLQIARQNILEPSVVQESIDAFAFDLKVNHKAKSLKKSPLDFFMGILRNGSVYAPPPNYKSPKEVALEAFIQRQNRLQELEEKAVHTEFQLWLKKLTPEEKNQIVPEKTRQTGMQPLINQTLKTYFKENLWPDIAQKAGFYDSV